MLEDTPILARRKRRASLRRNLICGIVSLSIFVTCLIVLLVTPQPADTLPADGEYLYNHHLFIISATCISALATLISALKLLNRH